MLLGGLRRVLVNALGREPRPPQEKVVADLWRFIAAILGLPEDGPDAGTSDGPAYGSA
jgi:hypothetical protein